MVEHVDETYSVRDLAGAIARTLARAFPDELWVRGEIRDLNRSRAGHVYFNLVDAAADPGLPPVSIPVTLFASDRDAVNRVLLRAGGAVRMDDGIEIRIRGSVSYYPARGTVQIQMTWIDTEYTLGRLAAERDRLLRALAAEGLLERNRTRALPAVPLRVGLVTSAGSAAHADFMHELEASGFAWKVALADARVQGADAAISIVSAFEALSRRHLDVVALVRGGGAKTDLAAFDDERVARAIAHSPHPVLTGIGHEVDATVADEVAHTRHKTPTACAGALVALVRAYLDALDRLRAGIALEARHSVMRGGRLLEERAVRVGRATHGGMRVARSQLDDRSGRLVRAAARATGRLDEALRVVATQTAGAATARVGELDRELDRLVARLRSAPVRMLRDRTSGVDRLADVVRAADPALLRSRGWTLVRLRGDLVGTARGLRVGDPVTIEFVDGTVGATVDRIQAPDGDDGGDRMGENRPDDDTSSRR